MIDVINKMPDSNIIDSWQKELTTATNELKKAEAEASKAEIGYTNATQWEVKLRAWKDSLEQTAELTKILEAELSVFQTQIGVVAASTACVVQAIQILYCEVKKVFYNPTGLPYPSDVESLSQFVQKLQKDVYCLGNPPNLNKNGGFLKKLTEFEAKLKTVEDVRDDILKKLIALVQSVNLMQTAICDNNDGLKGIVLGLYCEFHGGDTTDEAGNSFEPLSMPTNCGCHHSDDSAEHSCNSSLRPIIKFPLKEDNFVKEIVQKHATSLGEKTKTEDAYKESRKTRDRWLARKNGLEKAIAAATAAQK